MAASAKGSPAPTTHLRRHPRVQMRRHGCSLTRHRIHSHTHMRRPARPIVTFAWCTEWRRGCIAGTGCAVRVKCAGLPGRAHQVEKTIVHFCRSFAVRACSHQERERTVTARACARVIALRAPTTAERMRRRTTVSAPQFSRCACHCRIAALTPATAPTATVTATRHSHSLVARSHV